MLNLIKMDLYRMFHSLSTWIIILFTVGIALFCVVMVQGDLDAMADDPAYALEMEQEAANSSDGNEDRQIGLYSESDPEWIGSAVSAEPGDRCSDPFPLHSDKEFRIQYDGGDRDGDGAFRSAVFCHQQSGLRDTSFLEL